MATSVGRPDGLERFEADVPGLPFAFDVLDGAVLVPAQITACVFKAADCQTSPGGLWGPDATELQKDAATIEEAPIGRGKGDGQGSARDRGARQGQSRRRRISFATRTGLLARGTTPAVATSRKARSAIAPRSLTEARAALLEARLAALLPGAAAKPGKTAAETKKKKKPAGDTD